MKKIMIMSMFIFLIACHYGHIEKSIQVETKAYLEFKGNLKDVTFTIDDGSKIRPRKSSHASIFKYSLVPGVHILKVYRNDELIYNEKFYIGSQETKEVKVQ